ncbi:ankyrin repeat-containing domain protein [Triangularia setosa]|uniref:Ankyrin repeat-containing domain protein n=1 Tax=Triangularia setosa TaxID=2587417 RepID=A0AAN6VX42_9PEZI|nr:ankyrin repeat-containing domain protein [Podospora setosa]
MGRKQPSSPINRLRNLIELPQTYIYMADPFGIIGVIGVVAQIAQIAVKLGLDWKDAPVDARCFIIEIQTLKTVLSETHTNILVNNEFKNAFDGRHSTLLAQLGDAAQPTTPLTNTSTMVSACKQELDSFLDDLEKRAKGHRVGWERLKGAFQAGKTRKTVENLQRQCGTLNSLMAVDNLTLAANIHKEVTEARKEQQGWQADRENKAVLDWVTTADYSSQQSDLLGRRQTGTGQWLLDSTKYQQWTEATKKTLFCPGIPGAGKTILTSIVVDDLHTRFRYDVRVGIAYLYCNFRRHADQKVEDLLSNLIRQLAQDQSLFPECLKVLYDKHKGRTRPSLDELSRALQTVANLFSRIFIVVDALDECQLGSQSKLLTEIFALQSKTGANIFATSRSILGITERFKDGVSLEIQAQPEDVERYIKGNVTRMPSCVTQNRDLQKEIITKITQAVDGMFLLAQLHLDSLKGKRSPKAVRTALETLHKGSQAYDHAYNDAMDRIEGQFTDQKELAKQVLSWITCAKRPLSTMELQDALGVELGETELDPSNIPLVEDIVSVCAGLVTVDEDSKIIRLVHYTTQEYFERRWKRWFPNAQAYIRDICATYMSFNTFKSGPCLTDSEFEDRLQLNKLYDYATRYWGKHAHDAGGISQVALEFLKSDTLVEAQVQAMMTIKRPWSAKFYSQEFPKRMQGLLVAAYFGILEAAETLLESSNNNNLNDSFGRTPLSWAAGNGHEKVVKILLDTAKVDVDSKDKYGRTPLSWAAGNGHEAVVKMLFDTGKVDADSKDKYGSTALRRAAANGHETVVKMLFDTGKVDVDSRDNDGRTPLWWAAMKGHEAVVKMLFDMGKVNVDSKDKYGQTPLWRAAANGHETVAKILLDTGNVDIDSKDNDGRTPLWSAVENGHETVVKILLDTAKVDVHSKDNDGRTPLLRAAVNGHEAVVKMLFDTGKVDIDSKDNDGRTPLLWAARNGQEGAVKTLFDTGKVDINSKDNYGRTPLSWAAANGHETVVKMLLDTSKVDVDSKDNDGRTPLLRAAGNGQEAVAKLLLEAGNVDATVEDMCGLTALQLSFLNHHRNVERLLSAYNVPIVSDFYGLQSLFHNAT